MNRYILTIMLTLSFGCMVSQARQILDLESGVVTESKISTVPTRDVQILPDGVLVSYEFSKALLHNDDVYPDTYWWKIEGLSNYDIPGRGATPFGVDSFTVPSGKMASVQILDCEYLEFDYELTPGREPLPDDTYDGYSASNVSPINIVDEWLPDDAVEDFSSYCYRGVDVFNVGVNPVQYNSSTKKVRAYRTITYKVLFESLPHFDSDGGPEDVFNTAMMPDDSYLLNNTLNGGVNEKSKVADASVQSAIQIKQDYLIITVPKYLEAVEEFAAWKRMLGFTVHIKSQENWTVASISETVKQCYKNFDALGYLLIVGDHEDVPGKAAQALKKYKYVTDYDYGCIDDDNVADICRGRIPVNTLEEARTVFNKIIQYEMSPVNDDSFYNNGVNCAYFQDRDDPEEGTELDGYADRRFAQTSEDVRNYLILQNKNIERVYCADANVVPMFWNKGTYSYGEEIPDELKIPNFAWDGCAADITNAIDKGVFYVLHRDHGNFISWGDPEFFRSDVKALKNGKKLPVVFSMNCETGKYNGVTCFAEEFIKNPNGGCVGIFCATSTSFSGANDILTCAMFDAIWPDPGLLIKIPYLSGYNSESKPICRLGQILDQGFSKVFQSYTYESSTVKCTREIFHCFGDPSMMIYTEKPTEYKDVLCEYWGETLKVSLSNEKAYISIVDLETKASVSYFGSNVEIATQNPDKTIVCISGHNKIPMIIIPQESKLGNVYIQNENISDNRTIKGNTIRIGTAVTEQKSKCPVQINGKQIVITGEDILISPDTSMKGDVIFKTK